ncbi:hypothetical protein PTKIN_Ptkin16aG0519200 [Pterospermum kingtungense]
MKRRFGWSSQTLFDHDQRQPHRRYEWWASLPTVFVNNLSKRVSKRALWEVFNHYGTVMDVFVKFHSRKPFTFAFIRFKLESDCQRAVVEVNNNAQRTRGDRTYKEVLMGNVNDTGAFVPPGECLKGAESTEARPCLKESVEEASFNFELKENDVNWLEFVIIGRLKENMDWRYVAKLMSENDVPC